MKMRSHGIIIAMLSVIFSVAVPGVVNANNPNGDTTPVEVKYIGQMNDQPLFQLNIKNDGKEEYTIVFTDQDGTKLYSDKVTGKDYSKKFLINVDEMGGNPIKVEVKSKSSTKSEVFQIETNNRFVQETEASVTKL